MKSSEFPCLLRPHEGYYAVDLIFFLRCCGPPAHLEDSKKNEMLIVRIVAKILA